MYICTYVYVYIYVYIYIYAINVCALNNMHLTTSNIYI